MREHAITYATVQGSELDDDGMRNITVDQFGVKTADEIAPFGDDSCPVNNISAIYAETSNSADQVILGYANQQQQAQPGEKRLYAVKADGTPGFYIWMKADGTVLMGGDSDNLVRYTPLNTALSNLASQLNAELTKIAAAIASLGGSYVPTEISIDITQSKITQIKCL